MHSGQLLMEQGYFRPELLILSIKVARDLLVLVQVIRQIGEPSDDVCCLLGEGLGH